MSTPVLPVGAVRSQVLGCCCFWSVFAAASHPHTHTHTPQPAGSFSYESAELILIQIRSVLKGLHQYIDSFYEGHQTAITGRQGVPFGERLPRVTDEPSGDGSWCAGPPELWACSWEGGAAYWVLDSLVRQRQTNLLSDRAAPTSVGSKLFHCFIAWGCLVQGGKKQTNNKK